MCESLKRAVEYSANSNQVTQHTTFIIMGRSFMVKQFLNVSEDIGVYSVDGSAVNNLAPPQYTDDLGKYVDL